jgi:hypothetical protein
MPANTLAPRIDRLLADSMLLGHLGHRAVVSFAQDVQHLLFGRSSLFSLVPSLLREKPISSFDWFEKS